MVVKGVSINLKRGRVGGPSRPNGAGKTTVFYMITGLIKPDEGSVHIDGYDVTSLSMYRRARLGIGYLPQEASIFRGLSVEDDIMAVLEVTEPDEKGAQEAPGRALGGVQDRALAQVSIHRPVRR